jgi:hypothetical protein
MTSILRVQGVVARVPTGRLHPNRLGAWGQDFHYVPTKIFNSSMCKKKGAVLSEKNLFSPLPLFFGCVYLNLSCAPWEAPLSTRGATTVVALVLYRQI